MTVVEVALDGDFFKAINAESDGRISSQSIGCYDKTASAARAISALFGAQQRCIDALEFHAEMDAPGIGHLLLGDGIQPAQPALECLIELYGSARSLHVGNR